jgi:hypothetical protein
LFVRRRVAERPLLLLKVCRSSNGDMVSDKLGSHKNSDFYKISDACEDRVSFWGRQSPQFAIDRALNLFRPDLQE